MLGRMYTPFGDFLSYDLCVTAGSVVGILVMVIVLWRCALPITVAGNKIRITLEKLALSSALLGLVIFIGGYASSFVRQMTHADFESVHELMGSVLARHGNHFVGRLIVIAVLYPILYTLIYRLLFRGKGDVDGDRRLTMNAMAFYVVIQHFLSRLGCLLNGCCYGKPYDGPGSILFPDPTIPYRVFPTQILEMAGMVIIAIVITILWKKKKDVFGVTLAGFSIVIFISEHFMDKRGTLLWHHLTAIQIASIVLFCISLLYFWWEKRSK